MKTLAIPCPTIPFLKDIRDIAKSKKTKCYLVGGFLRDYLLGRSCSDFDFAVSKNAVSLARAFAKDIKGAFVLLDKEHGCARVVKKAAGGTMTFDFADFRHKTLQGDLTHRDFTVNTLCADIDGLLARKPFKKILIDGKGALRDLRAQKIKMVTKKAFREDPLRLVRAFSLRAETGFNIEESTLKQIKKEKDSLKEVAYERVRDELFKILSTERAAETLKQMDKIGLLELIIPQISVMYKVEQGGYHHLDVWQHTLEALGQMEKLFKELKNDRDIQEYLDEQIISDRRRFALMKLGILLHDIGKPATRKKEGNKTYFHGHERVGSKIARPVAGFLKLSTREKYILEDMVFFHLRPGYLSNFKKPSARAVFRYFRDTKEEAVSILLLSLADQRATRGPLTTEYDQKHHEEIVMRLIKEYFDQKKQKPFVRLIGGDDLIRTLKLTPSPLFAKILAEVEERQVLGGIATKKEALSLAEKMAASVKN